MKNSNRVQVSGKIASFSSKIMSGRERFIVNISDIHRTDTNEWLSDNISFVKNKWLLNVKRFDEVKFDATLEYTKSKKAKKNRKHDYDANLTRPSKLIINDIKQ